MITNPPSMSFKGMAGKYGAIEKRAKNKPQSRQNRTETRHKVRMKGTRP